MLAISSGITYHYWPNSDSPTTESVELRIRQELAEHTFKKFLSDPTFTLAWHEQLWQAKIDAEPFITNDNKLWWDALIKKILNLYHAKIEESLSKSALEDAQNSFKFYTRYGPSFEDASSLQNQITQLSQKLRATEPKRATAILPRVPPVQSSSTQTTVAQPKNLNEANSSYKTALKTINQQLYCVNTPNLQDLTIAIGQLKSLNTQAYTKDEPQIIVALASCMQKISETSLTRANELRTMALQLFPRNSLITGLHFAATDNCSKSLAGAGNKGDRYNCKDTINEGNKTPRLVVVPGTSELKSFAIGKYETTVDEFNLYCKQSGRCSPLTGDGNLPATRISLEQAQNYAAWLSKKAGRNYRLPTRAEWLHAARAGTEQADDNRNCTLDTREIHKGQVLLNASIGAANHWGLVNMAGNAQEWTLTGASILAQGGSHKTQWAQCTINAAISSNGKADDVSGFRLVRELIEDK